MPGHNCARPARAQRVNRRNKESQIARRSATTRRFRRRVRRCAGKRRSLLDGPFLGLPRLGLFRLVAVFGQVKRASLPAGGNEEREGDQDAEAAQWKLRIVPEFSTANWRSRINPHFHRGGRKERGDKTIASTRSRVKTVVTGRFGSAPTLNSHVFFLVF